MPNHNQYIELFSTGIKNGEIDGPRSAFFNFITVSSESEVRALKLGIIHEDWYKHANIEVLNRVFSLNAMHQELMKRLDSKHTRFISTKEKIKLLGNNQWIKVLYGNINEEDSIKLYKAMRNYERALRLIPNQYSMFIDLNKIDWGSMTAFAIAVTIDAVLIKYALPMVAGSLMATALVSAQIACIGIAAIALFNEINKHDARCNKLNDKLRNLKLSEKIEDNKVIAQNAAINEVNLGLMSESLKSFITALKNNTDMSLIEKYIGYNGKFHAFKNVDNKTYTAVCMLLRQLDAEQGRVHRYDSMIKGYLGMSACATGLAALVVGLTQTKDMFSLVAGSIVIGGYLSVLALCCATALFLGDKPVDTMPMLTKTIDALNKIETDLNHNSDTLSQEDIKFDNSNVFILYQQEKYNPPVEEKLKQNKSHDQIVLR